MNTRIISVFTECKHAISVREVFMYGIIFEREPGTTREI